MHAVVMGVSGCGKSRVGVRLAERLGLPLIEGDMFHPPANRDKMARGEALTDADRAGWLRILSQQLVQHRGGAVLACSALKKSYRDVLRAPLPRLAFMHLSLTRQQAQQRVAARTDHFYPASLVASQFETLEDPAAEPDVLVLDATAQIEELARRASDWMLARDNLPN